MLRFKEWIHGSVYDLLSSELLINISGVSLPFDLGSVGYFHMLVPELFPIDTVEKFVRLDPFQTTVTITEPSLGVPHQDLL